MDGAEKVKPRKVNPTKARFERLITTVGTYLSDADVRKIRRAFVFSSGVHKEQRRKSGEPYIIHPVEVAFILAELRMDADSICAALLHDTVEDTDTSFEDVSDEFGPTVATLVDGVTKISKIEVESLTESQASTLRKMLKAGDPVDIKLWTKSGEIQEWRNCVPLRYDFYKGTQRFKLLNSGQIRLARICCIFSVNNLEIFL